MRTNDNAPLHSTRSHVKRGPGRALYERAVLDDILDATLLCTIAQSIDGQPFATPTCHWRDDDYLYWHGHAKARNLAIGQEVCVNIAQLDALVLARSAFHHSVNYRSATLFGQAEAITDPAEKARQLERFVEKVSPGRWGLLRPMTDNEVKATGVVRLHIKDASCKIRAAGVLDDDEDLNWPVWAGVIPLERQWGVGLQEQQTAAFKLPNTPIKAY